MNAIAIHAEGLTKVYHKTAAVKDLSLHIPAGTVYGFLGPNGAGKTTTIRMLLGLIRPSAGTARVLGHDIIQGRRQIAPQVGAMVETPAFYTYLSGLDNLRVLAGSGGLTLPPARYDSLLELVGLRGRGRDKVKTYSLGMRQRLGIAATLLNDPKVIFLDEPTNGLDPAGTVEMRQLILRLGQEGRTVFLSSHLLHEVEQVCAEVAIVKNGAAIRQGRVRDLLAAEGESGYAIEARPLDRALAVLRGYPQLGACAQERGQIHVRAQPQEVPHIVRALVSANVDVLQVLARQPSLESWFLKITGGNGKAVQPLQPKGGLSCGV
jgi:ABC-type multidrug transport system ATPase subunit